MATGKIKSFISDVTTIVLGQNNIYTPLFRMGGTGTMIMLPVANVPKTVTVSNAQWYDATDWQ